MFPLKIHEWKHAIYIVFTLNFKKFILCQEIIPYQYIQSSLICYGCILFHCIIIIFQQSHINGHLGSFLSSAIRARSAMTNHKFRLFPKSELMCICGTNYEKWAFWTKGECVILIDFAKFSIVADASIYTLQQFTREPHNHT